MAIETHKIQIDDVLTGQSEVRDMTQTEIAQLQAVVAEFQDLDAELEAREQLRQSAISKLVAGQPLTTAEAELLVIR